jgi:hypothetical protein
MNPCARGCCWSPYSCALDRSCACHWDERKPSLAAGNTAGRHRDPTANEAINNVMKETMKG